MFITNYRSDIFKKVFVLIAFSVTYTNWFLQYLSVCHKDGSQLMNMLTELKIKHPFRIGMSKSRLAVEI